VAWKSFQKFKKMINFSTQISLCLDLTREVIDDKDIERWCSENLKMVTICKSLFLINKKGVTVLSRAHQRIIRKFMTYKVKITLKGNQNYKNNINKSSEMAQCSCKRDPGLAKNCVC